MSRRDPRRKRERHALDDDGMVRCNPRDREAAHRAQVEGIATEVASEVTCPTCLAASPRVKRREHSLHHRAHREEDE